MDGHKCNICNKEYTSYKSLWNHNKIKHTNTINQLSAVTQSSINQISVIDKKYKCKYCENLYNHLQSRWKHEKKCSNKNNKTIVDEILMKNKEIEILKLKLELEKAKKLDNKTFKAINKILKDKAANKIKMIATNGNIANNSHNVINNIQINGFGKEEILETLTMKEKKQILNSKMLCLEKFVEIAHCGNYTQFKNIIITNMKDNFAYKFDEKLGYFILTTKNELFSDLLTNRIFDIEAIYDELSEANKIDDNTKEIIQKFLDKIQDDSTEFIDYEEDHKYDNYKKYKIDKIKILLYNNQDKITKDIALLISS